MKKIFFCAVMMFAAICISSCKKDKENEPSNSAIPEVPAIIENMLGKSVDEQKSILESSGFRAMPIDDELVYIWSDVANFKNMSESKLETKAYYAPIYGTANISIAIEPSTSSGEEYGYYMSAYAYVNDAKDFCIKQSNSANKSVLTNQWAAGDGDELIYADHKGIAFSQHLADPMFLYENTENMTHAEYVTSKIGEGFEFGCNYVELTPQNVEGWNNELAGYYWGKSYYMISVMKEEGVTLWNYNRQSYHKFTN